MEYDHYKRFERMILEQKDEDLFSALLEGIKSFANYVAAVNEMEVIGALASVRFTGEAYREAIESQDRKRRAAHDAAIGYVRMFNRLATQNGLPPLYAGDLENRYAIGDFCMELTGEIFRHRR